MPIDSMSSWFKTCLLTRDNSQIMKLKKEEQDLPPRRITKILKSNLRRKQNAIYFDN